MGGFLAFASLYGVRVGLANASLSLLVYGGVVVVCRIAFARVPDRLPPLALGAAALGTIAVGLAPRRVVAVAGRPAAGRGRHGRRRGVQHARVLLGDLRDRLAVAARRGIRNSERRHRPRAGDRPDPARTGRRPVRHPVGVRRRRSHRGCGRAVDAPAATTLVGRQRRRRRCRRRVLRSDGRTVDAGSTTAGTTVPAANGIAAPHRVVHGRLIRRPLASTGADCDPRSERTRPLRRRRARRRLAGPRPPHHPDRRGRARPRGRARRRRVLRGRRRGRQAHRHARGPQRREADVPPRARVPRRRRGGAPRRADAEGAHRPAAHRVGLVRGRVRAGARRPARAASSSKAGTMPSSSRRCGAPTFASRASSWSTSRASTCSPRSSTSSVPDPAAAPASSSTTSSRLEGAAHRRRGRARPARPARARRGASVHRRLAGREAGPPRARRRGR